METPPTFLANVLAEIGPESCDHNMFMDILQQVSTRIQRSGIETQIAFALCMMTTAHSNHTNSARTWNIVEFGAACLEVFPKVDICQVFSLLPMTPISFDSVGCVSLIILGLKAMSTNFSLAFCSDTIFARWADPGKQLKMVYNMLLVPPDVFNLSQLRGKKIITAADYVGCPSNVAAMVNALESSSWNCMPLFEFTSQLIDTELFEQAKPIFELASRQCAELLCIALASIDPPWNSINKEILVKLCCGFLLGQQSSPVVLPRIWQLNPSILLFCMAEMYRRDPSCLSRLLDVAQELKMLAFLLDSKPSSFSMELALLAARRQVLNLEKWLVETINQKGEAFIRDMVSCLHQKILSLKVEGMPGGANLEVLLSLTNILSRYFTMMPKESAERFRETHFIISNSTAGEKTHLSVPDSSFAPDVEEEVNSLFDKIFVREIPIPDAVAFLRRLRDSKNPRDAQVLHCFLQNLFDEFRFFAKYPESELSLTAVLFGQIINNGVLPSSSLQLALKYVLDALSKPFGQKLFKFGLQTLAQFHARLPEWPQFSAQLLHLGHIQQHYPDLYQFIIKSTTPRTEAAAADRNTNGKASTNRNAIDLSLYQGTEFAQADSARSPSNILWEFAERQKFPTPSDLIRDRILFILNNLSPNNMETKANDLVKILEESHFGWLAQYLVIRRASIEPNYHKLYLDFLDTLQLHPLEHQVLMQTYSAIYYLLECPKIDSSINERTLLKNLGSWLGGLTLARNIPILYRNICLKELLLDATAKDRLISILPFVCKVVEHASRSIAFQPDNPWLMAILRVLAELYNYAGLKLNLKFEIEVLFKALGVDLGSLQPSALLRRRFESSHPTGAKGDLTLESCDSPCAAYAVLGPKVANWRTNSTFLRILGLAIEYSVRDIAVNAIQNALQQSLKTTKSIMAKDLRDDSDPRDYLQKYVSMAISIALNVVAVLTRESSKVSLANYIGLFSQWAGLNLQAEHVDTICEENVEVVIAFIEKFAFESSKNYFSKAISNEMGQGQTNVATQGGAPRELLELYAEYPKLSSFHRYESLPSFHLDPVSGDELEKLAASLASKPGKGVPGLLSLPQPASDIMSPGLPAADLDIDAYFETVCAKFVDLVSSIERVVGNTDAEIDSVSKLPPSHEIRSCMKQVILLASSSPIHRDELCLLMSQRLMQSLYRTDSKLYVDVIILLLIKIFELSSKAAKEVTTWVVHSTDERKYSVLATTALFGSGLIYVLDFDGQLAKQIESGRSEVVVPFTISLVRQCIFGEKPVAAPYDFVFTLEALGKYLASSTNDGTSDCPVQMRAEISNLLKDIASFVKSSQPESQMLRDQITFCYTDWFRLCQYPSISDKLISSFIAQLYQRHFMADEESARPFFQICTELSIELYVRQRRAPAVLAYRSIDAFARLIGQIIKYHPGSKTESCGLDPLRIITIAHSVVGLIFVQGQEQGLHYLQRPFTRLLACMGSELLRLDDGSCYNVTIDFFAVVENLSSFYLMISPVRFPHFAFGWLELVVNRQFLPRLLKNHGRGWPILLKLLMESLEFAGPLLQEVDANEATRLLYRGLIRCFLVILHDCCDFLVCFGRLLVTLLPFSATQLRNIMLAAVPSNLNNLPDPLSSSASNNFPKDELSGSLLELASSGIPRDVRHQLSVGGCSLSSIVTNHCSADTLQDLFISRVIFHLEVQEILKIDATELSPDTVRKSLLFTMVESAMAESNACLAYAVISSIVDGLTYPCGMTAISHHTLLVLFSDSSVTVREIITRVLLERLIVHRPHPWGLMVTLIELVRNERYHFWEFPYTRVTPEIERVFEAISKSCLLPDQ